MANIINGGDLMFFINGKSVAFATNHKLTINAETVETSSKDSGGKWVTKSVKKLSWNGTTENLYSNDGEGVTFDTLFDLMVARQPIDAVFALEGNSTDYAENKLDEVPTDGWTAVSAGTKTGKVIITSLEVNAPNGDNATFTCNFEGVGALVKDGETTPDGTGNTGSSGSGTSNDDGNNPL